MALALGNEPWKSSRAHHRSGDRVRAAKPEPSSYVVTGVTIGAIGAIGATTFDRQMQINRYLGKLIGAVEAQCPADWSTSTGKILDDVTPPLRITPNAA